MQVNVKVFKSEFGAFEMCNNYTNGHQIPTVPAVGAILRWQSTS